MTNKTMIRDFYNRVIGQIESDDRSTLKTARDFYGRYLGKYDSKSDTTYDFYNRIVGRGDLLASLIHQANEEDKRKTGRK